MTTDMGTPGAGPPSAGERRPRNEARAWLIVVVLALAVAYVIAFALENRKSVSIHWVIGTTQTSLIWVIFVTLALGVIVGALGVQLNRRRRRRRADAPDR